MSKRLQVILDDQEWMELAQVAQQEGVTVSHWVRRTLREARRQRPDADVDAKLRAVRRATSHQFPTADIEQMLAEIERGYQQSSGA